MTDEVQSVSNQCRLEQFYLPSKNADNSIDRAKRLNKRKVEPERKKTLAKIKSDSDDSNEQPVQPAINPNHYNTITKYYKPVTPKPDDKKIQLKAKEPIVIKDGDVKILTQKINEKEVAERVLIEEKSQLQQQLLKNDIIHKEFKQRSQTLLADSLKQNEDYRREKLREYLERERYRLGEYVSKRDSVRFMEEWHDGCEIKQVKENLKKMESEREELEIQKAALKKRSQLRKTSNCKQSKLLFTTLENGDNSQNTLELDFDQKKQRLNFQISVLSKEENQLKTTLSKLEEQKQQLVYKIRNYVEETQCRYSRCDPPWPCIAKRYQSLALLGKGGFSEVYKAFDLDEFKLCACKIHQLNPSWSESAKGNYIKHALRENEIHKRLKHNNIVSLYDTQDIDHDSFCTVLEFCDGGDLNQHLKKYKCLSEKDAKLIIKQVLTALHYMSQHQQKVIHYDLKPQNILFHKGEVKITDFGLCKVFDSEQSRLDLTSQGLGTYWYLPPECFQEQMNISINAKVDVWSVGVILYEMVFGKRPFGDGMSQERIVAEKIILKSTKLEFPLQKSGVSQECKDFIAKCLTYNMEARWTIQEAFRSVYLNKK